MDVREDSYSPSESTPPQRTRRGRGSFGFGPPPPPPLPSHQNHNHCYHYHHIQPQYNNRPFHPHSNFSANSRSDFDFNSNLVNLDQSSPALLPLPPILPLQLNSTSVLPHRNPNSTTHLENHSTKSRSNSLPPPPMATSSHAQASPSTISPVTIQQFTSPKSTRRLNDDSIPTQTLAVPKRPDSGGVEGRVISVFANHFRVQLDSSQQIFHYDVEISPNSSKEVARAIKRKLIEDNPDMFSGAYPAFDGRKSLYSPIKFQEDTLEFCVSLPIPNASKLQPSEEGKQLKLFHVKVRLVSKLDGKKLKKYLAKDGQEGNELVSLPQDYLHALDVILREGSSDKCMPVGRSLYSSSMGGSKEIGGGVVGLRGFFQSLRPTQQGLAVNLDLSVAAFHENIGVITYLQKQFDFLSDLSLRKTRMLTDEEREKVEKALKNIRVVVRHRDSVQKYRILSLTDEITDNLCFRDRDGKRFRVVNYFKDQYDYDIHYKNLPCLQISRSKPCYLPMELCVICEGQKYLGKLSDGQTSKILKMGCQKPKQRREMINEVVNGPNGPACENCGVGFKLQVSREMTRLNGRILQPPKLKFGDGGLVTNLVPSRLDCQWNLTGGHVIEGTRIERWALISFGGTPDQKRNIPQFINQLTSRCQQLGIFLNKQTTIPQFEPLQLLNKVPLLELKLRTIQKAASNKLQLLLCLMEKKHKGYGDLKRISETKIGVVSQCCLYSNLAKLSPQFLINLALKINAKVGGCTVALYNSLPSQIPRLLEYDKPVIFMGADVTHPHPFDDTSPSVAAVVGSTNWPASNKYVSRIRSQTHRQEIIQDLGGMVGEILGDFYQEVAKLPERIIFFRDGVSETLFYKVLKEELQSIREGCSSKFPGYRPLITFVVVQKRHHTRLFPDENDPNCVEFCNDNVPPGTVVDSVITHPREFDFYLCSHWGMKGTSRPTHYHVLWDESRFTSDEFQKLVYSLCFTFVRCTKPISMAPPAYYAHLAAYRGRLYLERTNESVMASGRNNATLISRTAPPKAMPLPKISEEIRKLMFYC